MDLVEHPRQQGAARTCDAIPGPVQDMYSIRASYNETRDNTGDQQGRRVSTSGTVLYMHMYTSTNTALFQHTWESSAVYMGGDIW